MVDNRVEFINAVENWSSISFRLSSRRALEDSVRDGISPNHMTPGAHAISKYFFPCLTRHRAILMRCIRLL